MTTLGDHIRKRRLDLGLLQRDVAAQLNVSAASVWLWESNESTTALRFIPAVIDFLGYNPEPQRPGIAGKILNWRTQHGIRRRVAAGLIGIDESTLARWERGEREPKGKQLRQLMQFFHDI